jgi:nucleotide-binding universal stress UspA family protein
MLKNILVAYDGSQPAEKAFDYGLALAANFGAALSVLAVARPPEFGDDVETEAILENAQEHFEKQFATLRTKASALGMAPNFEVRVGHPAQQIVHLAEELGVDQIVMGHRGKTLFQRWRLGSVSKQVIHYAHCTVTVVR